MTSTMKALIFSEPWNVKCVDVPMPQVGPHDVLAKVKSCGICGTDVGIYEGGHWIVSHGPGGHGHESGCEIVAVGDKVEGVRVGDRVARMGASYAQYTSEVNVVGHGKDEAAGALPIVRNDLTCDEISFADAVGCALNCAERAELDRITGRKPRAIILGLGPIGLLLARILIMRGVDVAASEPFAHKRDLAAKSGVKVFNPREFTRARHGRKNYVDAILEDFGPAHAVFEMVGQNETLVDAINLVRPGFRVLVFGAQKMQMIPYMECRLKGVELVYPEAMVNSKDDVDYWIPALDLLAGKNGPKLQVMDLITKRVTLEEAVHTFEHYNREEWIKIIVEPNSD